MEPISVPSRDELSEKLNRNEILFRKNYFQKVMLKYCCKNDWESMIYKIKYGNF